MNAPPKLENAMIVSHEVVHEGNKSKIVGISAAGKRRTVGVRKFEGDGNRAWEVRADWARAKVAALIAAGVLPAPEPEKAPAWALR
jgi:hypothetical protein